MPSRFHNEQLRALSIRSGGMDIVMDGGGIIMKCIHIHGHRVVCWCIVGWFWVSLPASCVYRNIRLRGPTGASWSGVKAIKWHLSPTPRLWCIAHRRSQRLVGWRAMATLGSLNKIEIISQCFPNLHHQKIKSPSNPYSPVVFHN